MESTHVAQHREPWNKGKLVGQKTPFKKSGRFGSGCRCTGDCGSLFGRNRPQPDATRPAQEASEMRDALELPRRARHNHLTPRSV